MNQGKNNNDPENPPPKHPYPKAVFFIIGNEFCERFSYYGIRTVLALYFINVLKTTDNEATLYYHLFAMAAYFTPVLGAIIADSLWGKFKTIFYISILYASGNIVISLASALQQGWLTWIGLAMIAFGTGGIKPCVAAFGGDQFNPGQEAQLQRFFSFFYISINAGSLISTSLTPIFREDVQCFGREDCFPLAFGVPAVLMIIALILFIFGKFFTNYKIVPPAKGNIVVTTCRVVCHALGKKMFGSGKKNHWLDYAEDKYDRQLINDIKALMRVLFLYLPIPIFWALFDQQGSRWTLQALSMDGDFFGVYRIKPDQVQVFNPLLIIAMVPIFEYLVYPCLAKVGLSLKPLKKIIIGCMLAAGAFAVCAILQLRIEAELPVHPSSNQAYISIVNGLDCDAKLINPDLFGKDGHLINATELYDLQNVDIKDEIKRFEMKLENCVLGASKTFKGELNITGGEIAIFTIARINRADSTVNVIKHPSPKLLEKPSKVAAKVQIFFNNFKIDLSDPTNENATFKIQAGGDHKHLLKPLRINETAIDLLYGENRTGATEFVEAEIPTDENLWYGLYLPINGTDHENESVVNFPVRQGATYIIVVGGSDTPKVTISTIVKPNTVKMLWQIIQYLMLTSGEVMFSITGLEFSYSQAPISMKAVLQAGWLLTVAFGNLIVVIIASVKIFSLQSYEFFFFAGLMVIDMGIFAIMAYFYVPYKDKLASDQDTHDDDGQNTQINGRNGHLIDQKQSFTNKAFNENEDATKF